MKTLIETYKEHDMGHLLINERSGKPSPEIGDTYEGGGMKATVTNIYRELDDLVVTLDNGQEVMIKQLSKMIEDGVCKLVK